MSLVPNRSSSPSPLQLALVILALVGTSSAQVRFDTHGGRHIDTGYPFQSAFPLAIDDIAAGDIDGDGDVDLVFATENGWARICFQDDRLDFRRSTSVGAGSQHYSAVALVDLDGDGDLDLVLGGGVRAYGSNSTSAVAWNQGNGTFVIGFVSATPMGCLHIASGDLDGDGDLDLVFFQSLGGMQLWRNDGTGGFADVSAAWLQTPGPSSGHGAVTDVDGDGFLDLFVPPVWLHNDGTGHLTQTNSLPLQARWYGAFDLDEDGDADAVCESGVYRNDGGAFTLVGSLPPTTFWYPAFTEFVATDVDGDGHVELCGQVGRGGQVGQLDVGRAFVLRDTGGFHYQDVSATWLEPHTLVDDSFDYTYPTVAAADLNGDGRIDLVLGGAEGRFNSSTTVGIPPRILVQQPSPPLTDIARRAFPFAEGTFFSLTTADVDGDGRLDVLADGDRLWMQDVHGNFSARPRFGALPVPRDGRFGDVDGDGDPDLLVAGTAVPGYPFPTPHLLRNDGGGVFTDVTIAQVPATPRNTSAVTLGDVDGDGDIDALFGSYFAPPAIVLWRNNGSGTFTEDLTALPPNLAFDCHRLELADLDGDGDLDLVASVGSLFGGTSSTPIRMFRNDGAGHFLEVTATAMPTGLLFDWDFQLLDLDGDGDLDLATDRSTLINNGSGTFSLLGAAYRALVADLDQDGAPDDVDYVLLSLSPSFGNNLWKGAIAADLDDDGDLDLVVGDHAIFLGNGDITHTEVLFNQLRDLRFVTLPRLGAPFELQLRAGNPNGTLALLALSQLLPQRLPLGELGDLWLDPAMLLLLGIPVIPDPDTAASWIVSVPNAAALLGLPVAVQALFGDLGLGRGPHLSAAMQHTLLP